MWNEAILVDTYKVVNELRLLHSQNPLEYMNAKIIKQRGCPVIKRGHRRNGNKRGE